MKCRFGKLTELQATLVVAAIISTILIALSAIGLFFNQPGWIIGVSIGSLAELVSIYLSDIGSTAALKNSKTGLFLLSYFIRMILFVGLFAMLVIFQYKLGYVVFRNSYWGMAIGFFPSLLITVAMQLKFQKGNEVKKDG